MAKPPFAPWSKLEIHFSLMVGDNHPPLKFCPVQDNIKKTEALSLTVYTPGSLNIEFRTNADMPPAIMVWTNRRSNPAPKDAQWKIMTVHGETSQVLEFRCDWLECPIGWLL